MDCNPPGSSVHGILQARVPEWVLSSIPVEKPFPSPGALSDPGIESVSLALQFMVFSGLLYPSTFLYIQSINFSEFAIETPTKNVKNKSKIQNT